MTAPRTLVSALAAALVLTACGGGGSSAPTPSSANAGASAGNNTVLGTASLTIQFPANYQRVTQTSTSANARKPAFVDPTNNTVLDIYVNGTEVINLDGLSPVDTVTVNATNPNGTFNVANIPLTSQTNDVAVIQWDSIAHSTIQSVGEQFPAVLTPGGATTLTLTMQMNATGAAITTSSNGSGAYELGTAGGQCLLYLGAPVYVYATDPLLGFSVTGNPGSGSTPVPSGYNGLPAITINSFASPADGSGAVTTVNGTTTAHFVNPAIGEAVFIFASFTNPAYAAITNFTNQTLYRLHAANAALFTSVPGPTVNSGTSSFENIFYCG